MHNVYLEGVRDRMPRPVREVLYVVIGVAGAVSTLTMLFLAVMGVDIPMQLLAANTVIAAVAGPFGFVAKAHLNPAQPSTDITSDDIAAKMAQSSHTWPLQDVDE